MMLPETTRKRGWSKAREEWKRMNRMGRIAARRLMDLMERQIVYGTGIPNPEYGYMNFPAR